MTLGGEDMRLPDAGSGGARRMKISKKNEEKRKEKTKTKRVIGAWYQAEPRLKCLEFPIEECWEAKVVEEKFTSASPTNRRNAAPLMFQFRNLPDCSNS